MEVIRNNMAARTSDLRLYLDVTDNKVIEWSILVETSANPNTFSV